MERGAMPALIECLYQDRAWLAALLSSDTGIVRKGGMTGCIPLVATLRLRVAGDPP